MKKILAVTVFLFVIFSSNIFGGEVTNRRLLGLDNYISTFSDNRPPINPNGARIATNYFRVVEREVQAQFGQLEGNAEVIDTALEWALVSYYSPSVVQIRPSEADAILPANNPRQADLKLGAAVFQDIQVLRFLADTNAAGRHEGMLKFITDRNNVTRAEVEAYYRNGIRALVNQIVDEEFRKERGDWVPYDVYVNSGHIGVIDAIKDIITAFFISPNATTYTTIRAVFSHFSDQLSRGVTFAGHTNSAIADAIISLNPALFEKINSDNLRSIVIPTEVQNNPAVRRATQNVQLKLLP